MLSNSLTLASSLVLCLAATATAQQPIQARKVLGPVMDAGIYHVASGTWFIAERDNVTDEFVRTYLYDPDSAQEGEIGRRGDRERAR